MRGHSLYLWQNTNLLVIVIICVIMISSVFLLTRWFYCELISFFFLQKLKNVILFPKQPARYILPVSYTHLDVYKRQEYTPGSTQVSILCNEREWEMAYQDSEYTAKIEVPLFERSEVIQVKLNDKGTIRTQELDWVIEPRYGAVLNVNARYDGHSVVHHNRQSHTYAPEQLVEIQLEKQGEFTIRSADVLVLLDGKEYKRFPVCLLYTSRCV